MREFGKKCFDHVAEFNFDKVGELNSIFEKTKDIDRILKELSLFTEVPIEAGKTLIIFDEIQASEGALNSLKENGGLLSCPIPLTDWLYKIVGLMKP